ncbi:hypothetical protein BD410DRAFT_847338 [Rickenella mellea]|uniref:Dynamin N-terminal domain-containing protein n=1 Tax=Rickenella mellea TaxID=50990 RepID=A0A4Y7PCX1_9AGAM|nr:hypothetical protein BD410DRAFT_847338 [Rickenella mellea]
MLPVSWGRLALGKRRHFINMASRSSLIISSSLESCTRDIQFGNPFELDGYNVTLIDTPGFDDTERSDTEILNLIAVYLSSSSVSISLSLSSSVESDI